MKIPHLDTAAMFLLIIGGLNAGISAVFDYNAINTLIGSGTANTVLYALVGMSALYMFVERMGWVGDEA